MRRYTAFIKEDAMSDTPIATPSRNSLVDPQPPRRTEATVAPTPSYAQWKQNKLKAKLQKKHGAKSEGTEHDASMSSFDKTFVADDTQMDVVVDPKAQPRDEDNVSLTTECPDDTVNGVDKDATEAPFDGFKKFTEAILQTYKCQSCDHEFFSSTKGSLTVHGDPKCPKCGAQDLKLLHEAWEKNPNCAQCGDKLSSADKAKGTVCAGCVKGNKGKLYDPNDDKDALDEQLISEDKIRYALIELDADSVVGWGPGIRSTKFYLRIMSDNAKFINGYEVNKDGDEIVPKNAKGADRRLRIIDKSVIKKMTPMKMDNTFGTLIKEGLDPDCDRCGARNIYQGKSKTWKPGKTVNLCNTCWNADEKGE